jgi:hypothetical protein
MLLEEDMNQNYTLHVIRNINQNEEEETTFSSVFGFPMCIHHAEVWAKGHGYKLIRSAKAIQAHSPNGWREPVDRYDKIYYCV